MGILVSKKRQIKIFAWRRKTLFNKGKSTNKWRLGCKKNTCIQRSIFYLGQKFINFFFLSSEVITCKLIIFFLKMSFTHFGPDLNQREDCRKNRWIWYENDSYSVWMDLLLLIKRKKEIFFVIFSSCDKILWPKLCVLCNDETCWRYILYIYISSGQDFGQILFSVEQNIKHIKNIHRKIYLLVNISTCH